MGSNDGVCGLTSRDRRERRELAHYSVPCEVTKRRELSANQREDPHQTPDLPTP